MHYLGPMFSLVPTQPNQVTFSLNKKLTVHLPLFSNSWFKPNQRGKRFGSYPYQKDQLQASSYKLQPEQDKHKEPAIGPV